MRKLGRTDEAAEVIGAALADEKFNFGALYEKYLNSGDAADKQAFIGIMRLDSHNYCELALDYLNAGMNRECIDVLETATEVCEQISPMVYYYMGYAGAVGAFEKGAAANPEYCFPNRLEAILALQKAVEVNPQDVKAYYYLGNLWYDKRQHDMAIACWEHSVRIDKTFPTALRNLALGYFNKLGRTEQALRLLEQAFAADTTDTRILMELDQLYKRLQKPHGERKAFLDKYFDQVGMRDDLYLEYVTLLNQLGEYRRAKDMIGRRKFHPWEGGEGKVPTQYQYARVELAKSALRDRRFDEAIGLLKECYDYPHNLGEGKLRGAQENDFNYWMGCAFEGKGMADEAKRCFSLASEGLSELCDAMYYNDQKPDKIFYQGLAWLKLGDKEEAGRRFNRLIEYGKANLDNDVKIDYFAVSLPDLLIWEDDLNRRNKVHCHYMMGLGYLGLGDSENAEKHLKAAQALDINHQGVQCHMAMLS